MRREASLLCKALKTLDGLDYKHKFIFTNLCALHLCVRFF